MAKKKKVSLLDPVSLFRYIISSSYRKQTYLDYFILKRKVHNASKNIDSLRAKFELDYIEIRKNLEKHCGLPPSGE